MKTSEALRTMFNESGVTQVELQQKLGLKSQSSISQAFKNDLRMSSFVKYAEALGYEIQIQKKGSDDYETLESN